THTHACAHTNTEAHRLIIVFLDLSTSNASWITHIHTLRHTHTHTYIHSLFISLSVFHSLSLTQTHTHMFYLSQLGHTILNTQKRPRCFGSFMTSWGYGYENVQQIKSYSWPSIVHRYTLSHHCHVL